MKFFLVCGSIPLRIEVIKSGLAAFSLIMIMLLAGCSSHPQGPPGKGVLRGDRLVDLLVDMHYFEGVYAISNISASRHDMGADSLDFYLPVLEMHGIGREEFRKTMEYYSYNPPQFEALYNEVVDELNRRLSETDIENPYPAGPGDAPDGP
jgi:hypothetical protein